MTLGSSGVDSPIRMARARSALFLVASLAVGARVLGACTGEDPAPVAPASEATPPGERGGPCADGRCLVGLSCVDGLCVAVDASAGDAAGPVDSSDSAPPPSKNFTTIFVSSAAFGSNLGGVVGADGKCSALANDAGLPGRYVAILSTDAVHARNRFETTGAIKLRNGTVVAANSEALWTGDLAAAIDVDERTAKQAGQSIWTGTDPDGRRDRQLSTQCDAWTAAPSAGVETGRTDRTNSAWISQGGFDAGGTTACANTLRLFCIGPEEAP